MKQSRKDFIKKAHENACSEWKTNIEKEFPKLFKEDALVVGDWVCTSQGSIFRIEKIKGNRLTGYGIGYISEKWDAEYYATKSYCRLATDKEVEQALIKEANKRGFKNGLCYLGTTGRKSKLVFNSLEWYDDMLCDGYGTVVFKEGKWATIVETITKEQAEKELGKTILN